MKQRFVWWCLASIALSARLCFSTSICGNRVVEEGEECDDSSPCCVECLCDRSGCLAVPNGTCAYDCMAYEGWWSGYPGSTCATCNAKYTCAACATGYSGTALQYEAKCHACANNYVAGGETCEAKSGLQCASGDFVSMPLAVMPRTFVWTPDYKPLNTLCKWVRFSILGLVNNAHWYSITCNDPGGAVINVRGQNSSNSGDRGIWSIVYECTSDVSTNHTCIAYASETLTPNGVSLSFHMIQGHTYYVLLGDNNITTDTFTATFSLVSPPDIGATCINPYPLEGLDSSTFDNPVVSNFTSRDSTIYTDNACGLPWFFDKVPDNNVYYTAVWYYFAGMGDVVNIRGSTPATPSSVISIEIQEGCRGIRRCVGVSNGNGEIASFVAEKGRHYNIRAVVRGLLGATVSTTTLVTGYVEAWRSYCGNLPCNGRGNCTELNCDCDADNFLGDTCEAVCGNGITTSGLEECDLTAGCTTECLCDTASGYYPGTAGSCVTICGDHIVAGNETCDSTPHCSNVTCQCEAGTRALANSTCKDCICGDGVVDNGAENCTEYCDDDNCLQCSLCKPMHIVVGDVCTASCGNGQLDVLAGEQCETNGTGCNSSCLCDFSRGFAVMPTPTFDCKSLCGNQAVDSPIEVCDGGDGCSSTCTSCTSGYEPMTPYMRSCQKVCGNGKLDAGEQCDSGTGCSLSCTCVIPYAASSPVGLDCEIACGNGKLDTGEECDGGLGCDMSDCQCADGYKAYDPPSVDCYKSAMSTSLIIGIAIGGGVTLAICGALLVALLIHSRKKRGKSVDSTAGVPLVQFPGGGGEIALGAEPPPEAQLVEDFSLLPLRPSVTALTFGLGASQAPIEQTIVEEFTMTNYSDRKQLFVFWPKASGKFKLICNPTTETIKPGEGVVVQARIILYCTTKVHVILPFTINEEEATGKGPSRLLRGDIKVDVESKLTTKLDYDEIKVNMPAIGEGAFGTVYRGQWRGVDVAVKMLKVQGVDKDDAVVKEFLREVEMMDSLRGPHIINFLGAVTIPGKLCVVTEFCPLGSLGSLLRKQILPHLLKVKFAWDCAKGMNFLHSSGIVHRDLKSDNLLVVSTNIESSVVCKLTDFGTSKAVAPSKEPNMTSGIGTPIYMAPEILDGKTYTAAADIYSFAILLLELFLNKMPYRDQFTHPWEIANFVTDGNRPDIPPDCPERYAALIRRCWEQDPAARPPFTTVLSDLESVHSDALLAHKAESRKRRKEKQRAEGAIDVADVDIAMTAPSGSRRAITGSRSTKAATRATDAPL